MSYKSRPNAGQQDAKEGLRALWDKGGDIDEEIARFTVGDDREIDVHFARQDILGSLAHVKVIESAGLISTEDATALRSTLRDLYAVAQRGNLRPEAQDEDIHSMLERILTTRLGDPGKRVHVARSRNDQIATDVALWLREQALDAHGEVLELVRTLRTFAQAHHDKLLLGLTHMQPAMPSSFGMWASGYASLFLDDARQLRAAYDACDACPLGSAAGYGVPPKSVPIDRALSARLLGFSRSMEPVTAVQGGRGKPEASLLFALSQTAGTAARMAWDLILFVQPDKGFITLPEAFTTGSSIMPQKKNPDVLELVRGRSHMVRSALLEVLSLAGSLPSGYHRDFQLLKGPLVRGTEAARSIVRILTKVLPGVEINAGKAKAACSSDIYATERAFNLVAGGLPFRDAYRQVAAEVSAGRTFKGGIDSVPDLSSTFKQINERLRSAEPWQTHHHHRIEQINAALLWDH